MKSKEITIKAMKKKSKNGGISKKSKNKKSKKKGKKHSKIILSPPPSALETLCSTVADVLKINLEFSKDTLDKAVGKITNATCKRILRKDKAEESED